jgi:hypothetical protein
LTRSVKRLLSQPPARKPASSAEAVARPQARAKQV